MTSRLLLYLVASLPLAATHGPAEPAAHAPTPAAPAALDAATVKTRCEELEPGVLLSLKRRHEALQERERALATREAELAAKRAEVEQRIAGALAKLQVLEDRLEIGEAARAAEKKRIETLITTVAGLSPRKAAPILSGASPEVAVMVLSRLGPEQAGSLLTAMEPRVAAGLLERLARDNSREASRAAARSSP